MPRTATSAPLPFNGEWLAIWRFLWDGLRPLILILYSTIMLMYVQFEVV